MRIYFVLEHVGGKGGVETVVSKVAQGFTAEGHDVHIFLPSPSTDVTWELLLPNVHYYHNEVLKVQNRLQFISERAIGLSKTFSGLDTPDIVIATHVPQTVFYSRMAIGAKKYPSLVSWLHNPPERFGEPHLINYADLHWAISKGIQKKVGQLIENTASVEYIGNPFELNVNEIQPIIGQHFVFIGRLENQQKRIDLLFHALSHLSIPWTLDIFGTGPDEIKLKNLASQLMIKDNIQFHGWIQNPWERIETITSLVLTSDFEGMPMVIGEAMTRGIPVISTDCETGPSDLIINGQTGWLVPPGDVQKLTNVFYEVALLSQEELTVISKAAKKTLENYSLELVIGRMKSSLNM